jgi:hypothetical protein
MLILAVAMVAAPAMALITFEAWDDGDGLLRISYTGDGEQPRGVALEVSLTNDATVNNSSVVSVDLAYNCFIDSAWDMETTTPGSYLVGQEYGIPLANADVQGPVTTAVSVFAISMGVLDQTSNQLPGPGSTTNLITIQLTGTGTCDVTIIGDTTRGPDSGVVGSVIESNLSGGASIVHTGQSAPTGECYTGQPDFAEWELAGKPDCWCWPRQCRGDADGLMQGIPVVGLKWVDTWDLTKLIDAWQIKDPPKGPGITAEQACADFDHLRQGIPVVGLKRVDTWDLTILINNWQVKEPPKGPGIPADCEPRNVIPPGGE